MPRRIYCRRATCAYRRTDRETNCPLSAAHHSDPRPNLSFRRLCGSLHGKVLGPDNKPMAGVLVLLRNDVTGFTRMWRRRRTASSPSSTSRSTRMSCTSTCRASVRRIRPSTSTLRSPSTRRSRSLAGVSESINVTAEPSAAQLETDTSKSHIDIDKSYIAKAPATVPRGRWSRSSRPRPASPRTRTAASTSRAPTARASTSSTARRSPTRPASPSPTRSTPASPRRSR